jgi:hypothetical protein
MGLITAGAGVLTAEMFTALTSNLTADVGVMVPVGIGIMSIMLGVKVVPKVIYSFF